MSDLNMKELMKDARSLSDKDKALAIVAMRVEIDDLRSKLAESRGAGNSASEEIDDLYTERSELKGLLREARAFGWKHKGNCSVVDIVDGRSSGPCGCGVVDCLDKINVALRPGRGRGS